MLNGEVEPVEGCGYHETRDWAGLL
jgi:hypothetical protein